MLEFSTKTTGAPVSYIELSSGTFFPALILSWSIATWLIPSLLRSY